MPNVLYYHSPATQWMEALPLGNGSLGGMFFGTEADDRIDLNLDTLWSGCRSEKLNTYAIDSLDEVRRLVFAGEYEKAHALVTEKMLGFYNESYVALGTLQISILSVTGKCTDYSRYLDMDHALGKSHFVCNGISYDKEVFLSYPDNALAMRIRCDRSGGLNMELKLESELHHSVQASSDGKLVMRCKAPSHVEPLYVDSENPIVYEPEEIGMTAYTALQCHTEGGTVSAQTDRLQVAGADEVILLLAAATSYNGFDKIPGIQGKNPATLAESSLDKIKGLSYTQLKARHIADYAPFFGRVQLQLQNSNEEKIFIEDMLKDIKNGKDVPQFAALYFQFGRYLTLASSREGTQPITLQGIWNDSLRPHWSSNYTTNINTPMNYWHVDVANLSELSEPLFTMLAECAITGAKVAKTEFGCHGWTINHNVDLWRHTVPVAGSPGFAYWPMAGAWLCRHLYERYLFTLDTDFLSSTAYPLMKGAAEFMLDWLCETPEGSLTTCPSTSPENAFLSINGNLCNVSAGCTMDITIIEELFTHCIAAAETLNRDEDFRKRLLRARDRLQRPCIASDGRLMEWSKEFTESEPGHRHLSHLYGLYPSNVFFDAPYGKAYLTACRESLTYRLSHGSGRMGWSSAWAACLFARLGDGAAAYKMLQQPFS